MNIANITSRFALLCGIDKEEAYKWRTLVDDATAYVQSILVKDNLSESDKRRVEALCAVYAHKLYRLCNDERISSFSVGDVSVTSPKTSDISAENLWKEYAQKAQDLISDEKFLFGRVM